jgi:spermidine/putrescine-binding protein
MSKDEQMDTVRLLGIEIAQHADEFVKKTCDLLLKTVDSILSDSSLTQLEKFAMVKVVADVGWTRIAAVAYGNPKITVEEVSSKSLSHNDAALQLIEALKQQQEKSK